MRDLFRDHFFYMLYFQRPQAPEQELEADVEDSLRRMFHSLSADGIEDFSVAPDSTGVLQAMQPPPSPPRWMRDEDLAYYVARFEKTGFTGALNWYRAMDASWEGEPRRRQTGPSRRRSCFSAACRTRCCCSGKKP